MAGEGENNPKRPLAEPEQIGREPEIERERPNAVPRVLQHVGTLVTVDVLFAESEPVGDEVELLLEQRARELDSVGLRGKHVAPVWMLDACVVDRELGVKSCPHGVAVPHAERATPRRVAERAGREHDHKPCGMLVFSHTDDSISSRSGQRLERKQLCVQVDIK
eukprot:4388089-Prymnesium_polylepis.1